MRAAALVVVGTLVAACTDSDAGGMRRPSSVGADVIVVGVSGAFAENQIVAGFGTFGISERGERQGRNPQTGAPITIAASKVARFTAGKAVKDALNG